MPEIEERPHQATLQTSPPRGEELAHDYSTNTFLLHWDHFVAMRDRPTRVASNKGSQLTASHNTVKIVWLGWEEIESGEVERGAASETVPAGCQWRTDLAESQGTVSKLTLTRTLFRMLK